MRAKSIFLLAIVLMLGNVTSCSKKNDSVKAKPGGEDQSGQSTAQTIQQHETGWLQIKNADLQGHEVRKADTGEKVDRISSVRSTAELPAGIYDVTIGKSVWKGVEVKAKETTVLEPGVLVVQHASLSGHDIAEAETGIVQGNVSALNNNITLFPGKYNVMFGKLTWPAEVEAGKTTTVNPGTIEVVHAHYMGHKIFDKAGEVVGEVSHTTSSIPLPPGEYAIEIGGERISFTLKEGQAVKFENK